MAHFYKIFQRFTNGLLGALFDHFSLFEVKKTFSVVVDRTLGSSNATKYQHYFSASNKGRGGGQVVNKNAQ